MGGGFWDPKSIKNLSQNEVRQGRHPGIDLHVMLVNFGFQSGTPNLLKSYLKTDPKKDTQRMPSWRLKNPREALEPTPVGHPRFGSQLCLAARNTLIFKDEERLHAGNLQTLYRPLQTPFQRMPTRSWAPSVPVRIQCAAALRTRHHADC